MPPKPPSPRLTHFLCIPLSNHASLPLLRTSLATFRHSITKSTHANPSGIPDAAVRPLGTLHLTLGVMSLLSPERVQDALSTLKSLDLKEILSSSDGNKKERLEITLKGVKTMHDAKSTSVLYAPPLDEDGALLRFCQKVRDVFVEEELVVKDERPLLLHATVVNTIYVPDVRARGGGGGHGKRKAKLTFDAREMLEDWEDFMWMEGVRVEEVALCRMGAKKGDDGEERYEVEGSVAWPL